MALQGLHSPITCPEPCSTNMIMVLEVKNHENGTRLQALLCRAYIHKEALVEAWDLTRHNVEVVRVSLETGAIPYEA